MLERRGRAVQRARKAFVAEQEYFGDEFGPESPEVRLFQFIAIGEAAFHCEELTTTQDLVRAFADMLCHEDGEHL